jgi:hypothetical protein
MAAEMEQNAGAGSPELAQFWKDVPKTKIMDHRYTTINVSSWMGMGICEYLFIRFYYQFIQGAGSHLICHYQNL